MKFYRWGVAGHTKSVTTTKPLDSRYLTPYLDITDLTEPVPLTVVPGCDDLEACDFLHASPSFPIILSPKARAVLDRFLSESGEVTSVYVEGIGEYFAFTPRRVLDVIDLERSALRETRYVTFIEEAVFLSIELPPSTVFLAKGFERQKVWVTEEFLGLVNDAGLTGGDFW